MLAEREVPGAVDRHREHRRIGGEDRPGDQLFCSYSETVESEGRHLRAVRHPQIGRIRTPAQEPLVPGLEKGVINDLEAENAQYFLRFGDQVSQFATQALTTGPLQLKAQETKRGREYYYTTGDGANMVQVADAIAPSKIGNDAEKEAMLTALIAGERAKAVGWDKLNVTDPASAQAEYQQVVDALEASPRDKEMFHKAMDIYREYNAGLLDFLVDTGALTAQKAAELKNIAYVPFYRINDNGDVQLMIDKEHPVRIANIKDEPQLKELVGGNTAILPVFTSAAQNTFMITGMGLRNQATKSVANELQKIGLAQIIEGKTRAGRDIVQFKEDGKDYFAFIRDSEDVPAELLVKGLEGIPVQTSALLQMAGMPSRLIRNAFLANPISAGRTLFKDTMSSVIASGSGFKGMSKALRDVGDNLMELRGITGGEVFTGLPQDMSNILRQIQTGKPGWESLLAKAFVMHAKADATTRQLRYENYRKQGLSEMEATHMALESMNFTRRGISPSIHVLNTLHPFMNSQIQGLNTLIKAIRGNMTLDEKLKIRDKIIKRGMLLAGATMFYSAMMQDDDTYKNALPEQKYNNFFVPFPGVDEKVRIPIPFEAGILFKSVPEALINYMYGHDKDAAAGMRQAILKLIPAGESYGVPQILLPGVEAGLGKSFYTGRDILSNYEKQLLPEEQYRERRLFDEVAVRPLGLGKTRIAAVARIDAGTHAIEDDAHGEQYAQQSEQASIDRGDGQVR